MQKYRTKVRFAKKPRFYANMQDCQVNKFEQQSVFAASY
jgi:hypothetical protein